MKRQPYQGLPKEQFWKTSFGEGHIGGLDPVSSTRFTLDRSTRIAAAGSCFAQHVARQIRERGFNFLVTEQAHPVIGVKPMPGNEPSVFNYGLFSARYGNIYTARQLRQLVDRAYGRFAPIETAWPRRDGMFVDPFRPQIEPDGFVSPEEVAADARQHLGCVRRALEKADILVFTLGLTEAWIDRRDGATYPLAPGVAGGVYDETIHAFRNFDVASIVEDMNYVIAELRARNPALKLLLTVSPVPLNATYEPRHVLQSTVYSKSVLRVAAQMLHDSHDFVDYFPSFEIITSPQYAGQYFIKDKRTIAEQGVRHVMDVFFHHYAAEGAETAVAPPAPAEVAEAAHQADMERMAEVLCDEEAITAEA